MKQSETKNLLVTGCFLLVLMALIGAGIYPGNPAPERVPAPELDQYTSDAQFVQYLEYRAQLETSTKVRVRPSWRWTREPRRCARRSSRTSR
jgi:hypothetical protein